MKYFVRVAVILFSSILSMCVSVEEKHSPVSAEQGKDTTASQISVTAPSEKAEPALSDQDFLDTLALVTRAKDAGAETYSPGLYNESKTLLEDALSAREKNPADAKKLLAQAGEKAIAAFDESAKTVYSLFIEPLAEREESLDSLHARGYYPVEYSTCIEEGELAKKLYESSDITGALTNGKKASEDMASLFSQIRDGLSWVRILLADIGKGLDRFETDGTYAKEPERVDRILRAYYEGLGALEKYDLENAGKSLGLARKLCEGESIASVSEEENGERLIPGGTKDASKAEKKEYSIRSIPANRESLWTIAGYDFVYGDPFLWPLIWRMNRDTIENPAFILPGIRIVIPELPYSK